MSIFKDILKDFYKAREKHNLSTNKTFKEVKNDLAKFLWEEKFKEDELNNFCLYLKTLNLDNSASVLAFLCRAKYDGRYIMWLGYEKGLEKFYEMELPCFPHDNFNRLQGMLSKPEYQKYPLKDLTEETIKKYKIT